MVMNFGKGSNAARSDLKRAEVEILFVGSALINGQVYLEVES